MINDSLRFKFDLLRMKLDILKLQANDYSWQCETPEPVRNEILHTLMQIEAQLQAMEDNTPKPMDEAETRKLLLWLNENYNENDFIRALYNGLKKYRKLTPKQMLALQKTYYRIEGKGTSIERSKETSVPLTPAQEKNLETSFSYNTGEDDEEVPF